MKKTIEQLCSVFLILIISACGAGGGGGNGGSEVIDVSGTWQAEETVTDTNCQEVTLNRTYTLVVTQSGSTISITAASISATFDGTISGTIIAFSGEYPDSGGTTSGSYKGTVTPDGNTLEGTATWTWTDGTETCSGTTKITAKRITQPAGDVTGKWMGTWQSSLGASGIFSVDLIQQGSTLSGSISVPYINLFNANLKGSVSGNSITFGDIDETITFTGTFTNESSASGTYNYPTEGDNGSWQAAKTGDGTLPTTNLTSPNGGETWSGTQTITWVTTDDNPGTVEIRLSNDSGASFPTVIALAAPDNGTYLWDTTTVADGAGYRIQIVPTDADGNVGTPAKSAADFSISNGSVPPVNVSGAWEGTWQSNQGASGTFSVDLTQQGTTLSGSISVPDVGLSNAALKGTIDGTTIVFGDINDTITFTGTITDDSSASGTYNNPVLDDDGTWQATKTGSQIQTYSISVSVSGLTGTGLVLQNNGGDNLAVPGDGSFTFATALADGANYNVTVLTQPSNPAQTCSVSNGSGTVSGADVTDVQVSCSTIPTYTVGGTVSGMTGSGLTLQNNGGDDLVIADNGSFTFATAVPDSASYDVTVLIQPVNPAQFCSINNGSGIINGANITDIEVNCTTGASFGVGGTVSGLTGSGLVLQNNGGDNLAIPGDGSFTFTTALADGANYNVTVLTQPHLPTQTCAVSNDSGTVSGAPVTNIQIACITDRTHTYTVGGMVSGLTGSGLVLQNNGGDDLAIMTNGGFIFPTALASWASYSVTVHTQPTNPAQTCLVSNGTGSFVSDVTDVNVQCFDSSQSTKQFEETSYYLNDVDFISSSVGWAVGDPHWDQNAKAYTSTIIRSNDGGETWDPQPAGVTETLRGVDFVDTSNGWAVGTNGTILHTNDGGTMWSKQTVATTDEFRGVVFIDANNGWASTTRPVHYNSFGDADNWRANMWHTSDGGQTWSPQQLPTQASILNQVEFVDSQIGWAVGVKYIGDNLGQPEHVSAIYHTSNGGQTWTEQYSGEDDIVFTGVDFVDANHGWVVGFFGNSGIVGSTIFRTSNGGMTWQPLSVGNFDENLWDVQFLDENRGYAVGTWYPAAWGPPVYRTLDGGDTWQKVHMDKNDGEGFYGVAVLEDRVIAVGDYGYVSVSNDPWGTYDVSLDGTNLFTQKYINTHYRFEDVFFADENHGWAVGTRSYLPSVWGQAIFSTQNGGQTWESQYEKAPPPDSRFSYLRLDSVYFVDDQNGWAVGSSESTLVDNDREFYGAILHTTNGGMTWSEQGSELYQGREIEFFSVQFLDSQNGWALAARNPTNTQNIYLAKTTNGGTTWEWVDTGIAGSMAVGFSLVQGQAVFTDALHGWAAGGLGEIVYTNDGGVSWSKQNLFGNLPLRLFATAFTDNMTGWIAGEGLFHTTDGGATWTEKNVDWNGDFQDIQFVDSNNGWLTGERGVVLFTQDGGSTWSPAYSRTSFALRGSHFISPTKGWVVGDNGTIVAIDTSN